MMYRMGKWRCVLVYFAYMLLMCGCVSSHMNSTSVDTPFCGGWRRGGVYYLENRGGNLAEPLRAELLKIRNGDQLMFLMSPREDALPLSISLNREEEGKQGFIGVMSYCNNFLSACTLGIWPWISNKNTIRRLELRNECMSKCLEVESTHRVWSSFIVPFAAIPVFGWADSRKCNMDLGALEDDCGLPPVDYAVVAEAIADNLLQADYDAAVPKLIYTRSVSHQLDPRKTAQMDSALKEYALRHCPSEWNDLQKLRADLAVQDSQVQSLAQRLRAFGQSPNDNDIYLKACERRFFMSKELMKAYQRLEAMALGDATNF